MEQGTLSTKRMDISTQKMLGGIGTILILSVWLPAIGWLLGIVGLILLFVSMYKLSDMLKKPSIFKKFLIGFILMVINLLIAIVFGFAAFVSAFFAKDALTGIGLGTIGFFIVLYVVNVISHYLYKQAFETLALATGQNLFKIAGLLMFIGALTTIVFGLGGLLILIGYILLAVAFFIAPKVEV